MNIKRLNTDGAIKIYKEVEEDISKIEGFIDEKLSGEHGEVCLVKVEYLEVKIPVKEVIEMLTGHIRRQEIKAKYLKRILDQK